MFFAPTQRESDVKAMWRRTLDQCSTQSFKTLIETYRLGGGGQAALRNNNGRENHFHAWPPVFAAVFRIDSKQDPVEFALKARDKQAAGSVVGGCFYPLWWKGPRYRCFYVGTSISRVEKHLCSSGLQRLCKYLWKYLKALVFLYAFEESVDYHLLSSFCDDSNLHISLFKYVLCTMGVSKESISKFLIGNRFHVKLRIFSPENCKQAYRWKVERLK